MLVLSRLVGTSIVINGNVTVTVMSAHANKARLGIDAPPDVTVNRSEIEELKEPATVVPELHAEITKLVDAANAIAYAGVRTQRHWSMLKQALKEYERTISAIVNGHRWRDDENE
jgi:carbon storage regulator